MKDVKQSSSKWINENKLVKGHFEWQEGYGVFSYRQSHINSVYKYIENQEEHHKRQKFKEEYLAFLEKFEVPFDERYILVFEVKDKKLKALEEIVIFENWVY